MFDVELDVCLHCGQTWPKYKINLDENQFEYSSEYTKVVKYTGTVSDVLSLNYTVKDQQETIVKDGKIVRDQSIEILALQIDGIKIPKQMIEKLSQYVPLYRVDFLEYCKNANIAVDYGPMHSIKFWHAGNWSVALPSNFWHLYQQMRQLNIGTDFTGNSKEEIHNSLKKIRSLL